MSDQSHPLTKLAEAELAELTEGQRAELVSGMRRLIRILLTVENPDVRETTGIRHGVRPAPITFEQYHFDRPLWRRAYAAGMDDMLSWVHGLILCAAVLKDLTGLEERYLPKNVRLACETNWGW